jgi:hypothetical protein
MRIHLILVLVLSALPAVPAGALGRGGCQSRCPSGQRMCTHQNGSATCVDLDRDPPHAWCLRRRMIQMDHEDSRIHPLSSVRQRQ